MSEATDERPGGDGTARAAGRGALLMSPGPRLELRRTRTTSHAPDAIFATLCDLRLTPTWLPNCSALELLDQEALAAGARLRYSFHELGYTGSLACAVTGFIPGQHLAISFDDARVEARFDFRIAHHDGVTTIDHRVELLPKSLAVRLLSGVIRRGLPGRMEAALRGLDHAVSRAAQADA